MHFGENVSKLYYRYTVSNKINRTLNNNNNNNNMHTLLFYIRWPYYFDNVQTIYDLYTTGRL